MSLGVSLMERGYLPDVLTCWGIRRLLAARLRQKDLRDVEANRTQLMAWVQTLQDSPLAINTSDANAQHYEVPAAFFLKVLGPRLKYSSCLWTQDVSTLAQAEQAMLRLTCQRARIQDGQAILDLGCGWGSLSLWLAEHYPQAQITGVSNSRTQREFIVEQAESKNLLNLTIITADINDFAPTTRFDRVVSIEMMEHVRNYQQLFSRIRQWLKPDGKLFSHIFCHKQFAYPYELHGDDQTDWMTRYFFLGGQMPSDDLFLHFQDDLSIEEHWNVNGNHYAKTLRTWLAQMDAQQSDLMPLFRQTYGDQAVVWWNRWRVFFLACAELFAYQGGNEWYVSHYLFSPRSVGSSPASPTPTSHSQVTR